MINNNNKKAVIIFIFIFASSLLIYPEKNYSQTKYEFNFDYNWSWEDLINKVVLINPGLIKSVDNLKNKISNNDARILLKKLSVLDSLNYLLTLQNVARLDSQQSDLKWDLLLKSFMDSVRITEDFSGLLTAANKLSDIRTSNIKNEFDFGDKPYLAQSEKSFKKSIDIKFNYEGAENILKYFNGDTGSVNEVTDNSSYRFLFDEGSDPEISKNDLLINLKRSFSDEPLASIYKWVNPASYWNMGGVSVYKNNFINFVDNLKKNESNIKFDIEKQLS
ncbi:MAG: hypothetical protein ABI792_00655 [bacterium]